MRRDWDCVRAVLRAVADAPGPRCTVRPEDVNGWAPDVVAHHIAAMSEKGLLEANVHRLSDGGVYAVATGLTWAGEDLLESLSAAPLWNQIVKLARERGVGLGFDIVKELAVVAAKRMIGGS